MAAMEEEVIRRSGMVTTDVMSISFFLSRMHIFKPEGEARRIQCKEVEEVAIDKATGSHALSLRRHNFMQEADK